MNTFKILAAALLVLPSAAAQNSARFALGQVASPGGTGTRMELRIGCSVDREAELSAYAIQDTSGVQLTDQWSLWNGQIRISYGRLGQPPSVDTMSRDASLGLAVARWLDDGASVIRNIGWSPTMSLKVDVELLDSNGTPAGPTTTETFSVDSAAWCNFARICGQEQYGCGPASIRDSIIDEMQVLLYRYYSAAE